MSKGGLQALPKTSMPGGLIVGDDAGFLNVLKIKGSHTAMKSGMLAGDSVYESLKAGSEGGEDLASFAEKVAESWLHEELYTSRNIAPRFAQVWNSLRFLLCRRGSGGFQGQIAFYL